MPIELDKDLRQQAIASIKRYAEEELEQDLGDLKAEGLLRFFLEELAPTVYNQAIRDAQRYMQERALDLDGVCHEEEFGWSAAGKGRKRR
ncbi:MAG: DUF2164 domain-containing protein [Anaeromyxobacter sp.]